MGRTSSCLLTTTLAFVLLCAIADRTHAEWDDGAITISAAGMFQDPAVSTSDWTAGCAQAWQEGLQIAPPENGCAHRHRAGAFVDTWGGEDLATWSGSGGYRITALPGGVSAFYEVTFTWTGENPPAQLDVYLQKGRHTYGTGQVWDSAAPVGGGTAYVEAQSPAISGTGVLDAAFDDEHSTSTDPIGPLPVPVVASQASLLSGLSELYAFARVETGRCDGAGEVHAEDWITAWRPAP